MKKGVSPFKTLKELILTDNELLSFEREIASMTATTAYSILPVSYIY